MPHKVRCEKQNCPANPPWRRCWVLVRDWGDDWDTKVLCERCATGYDRSRRYQPSSHPRRRSA